MSLKQNNEDYGNGKDFAKDLISDVYFYSRKYYRNIDLSHEFQARSQDWPGDGEMAYEGMMDQLALFDKCKYHQVVVSIFAAREDKTLTASEKTQFIQDEKARISYNVCTCGVSHVRLT